MYGISCNKKIISALHRYFLTTPSSALKQSSKFLECLLEACSVSILRAVVLWKDWKHVLHLIDWAAVFCDVQYGLPDPKPRAVVFTYRLQLTLCLLGALVARSLTLLLCPVKPSVSPPCWLRIAVSYLAPLPILSVSRESLRGQ